MYKENNKGYTMTEVISVLAIIGMLMSSMAMLISSLFDKYKKNQVQDQLLTIEKRINQRYVADKNYTGIDVAELIEEQVFPKDVVNGDKVVNVYGDVEIVGYETTYTIQFTGIPLTACVALGVMGWVNTDSTDLVSLTINGTTSAWPYKGEQTDDTSLPLDAGRLAQKCTRLNNTMMWEFQ